MKKPQTKEEYDRLEEMKYASHRGYVIITRGDQKIVRNSRGEFLDGKTGEKIEDDGLLEFYYRRRVPLEDKYNKGDRQYAIQVYIAFYVWDFCEEIEFDGEAELVMEARESFEKYEDALEEEPWADNGHAGDCTGMPTTCIRCLMEKFYEEGQKIRYD